MSAPVDRFETRLPSAVGPSGDFEVVTPDDDNDLSGGVCRAISFGVAGDLHVTTDAGEEVTIPSGALAAGSMHPIRVSRIHESGTTADDIVAYY